MNYAFEGGYINPKEKVNVKKQPNALENQLEEIEETIGHDITPLSIERYEVLSMDEAELKEKFPKRYQMYVNLLKTKRHEGTINQEDSDFIDIKKWFGILNSLDQYIEKYDKEISEDPRHPVQQEVFSALRDFLEKGETSGYVKLPTGAGKTVVFKRFLEAIQARSMVVVPNNVLVDQTADRFSTSDFQDDIGIINKDSKKFDAGCTITTYASLIRNIENGNLNPDDYACLVLDEAHKALGEKTAEAINSFKKSIKIGFTATPEYTTDKNLLQLLDHEIYEMKVDEAIRAGMLSHARTWVVKTNVDLSSVGLIRGGYIEKELAKKVNDQGRNTLAVEYYKAKFLGQQGVVYCADVDHATEMASLFEDDDISAEVVSGRNSKTELQQILLRFETGETQILCNAKILIEGFDSEHARVCMNLKPTMSAVDAEQRGGRVLRLDSNDENKVGCVVDFLDDDQFAASLKRPYPLLYREVLGAVAVPRAIANKSSAVTTGSKQNIQLGLNTIPNMQVIGTEEQFQEILHKKSEYKMKQEQRKRKKELQLLAEEFRTEFFKNWPDIDIKLSGLRQTANDLKQEIVDLKLLVGNKENNIFRLGRLESEISDIYIFMKDLLADDKETLCSLLDQDAHLLKTVHNRVEEAGIQMEKFSHDWQSLKSNNKEKIGSREKRREFLNKDVERDESLWITKQEIRKKIVAPTAVLNKVIKEIESDYPELVSDRRIGFMRSFVSIYSPEFVKEAEIRSSSEYDASWLDRYEKIVADISTEIEENDLTKDAIESGMISQEEFVNKAKTLLKKHRFDIMLGKDVHPKEIVTSVLDELTS